MTMQTMRRVQFSRLISHGSVRIVFVASCIGLICIVRQIYVGLLFESNVFSCDVEMHVLADVFDVCNVELSKGCGGFSIDYSDFSIEDCFVPIDAKVSKGVSICLFLEDFCNKYEMPMHMNSITREISIAPPPLNVAFSNQMEELFPLISRRRFFDEPP